MRRYFVYAYFLVLVFFSFLSYKNYSYSKQYVKTTVENENLENRLHKELVLGTIFLLVVFYTLYIFLNRKIQLRDSTKKRQQLFKKTIDILPNPIFIKDKEGKYLLLNDVAAKLLGDDRENILKKTNQELNLDKQLCILLDKDEKETFDTKTIVNKSVHNIKDRFYRFVYLPIFDFEYPTEKEVVLGFAIDISLEIRKKNELKRLNKKSKQELIKIMNYRTKIDEKFKKIFDNINEAMFVCKLDKDGVLCEFEEINSSGNIFLNQFKQFRDKKPNEIFDGFKFKYNEKIQNFEVRKYNYILNIPNKNDQISFQVSCNIIFFKDSFHAVIFVQLVDEVIKLKLEKKEKQILIKNIFKKAKSGIAVIDQKGKIVKYNKSFCDILGLKEEQLQEGNFFDVFDFHKKKMMIKEHKNLFKKELEFSNDYKITVKDRSLYIVGSSTLIEDSNGKKHRLFIFEDITRLKELEKEQFNNSKIIAQQAKMAEMGEMIGAIAHQWRQPLNAINAAAIKLNFSHSLDNLEENEISEKTVFIEQQCLKMSETINDFMNFFKPSKSKEKFELNSVYKKIFDFLEPQLKNRAISLSFDNPNNIKIFGFKNEFEHILLNLINNSKDAFDDIEDEKTDKKIMILVSENQKHIVIKISDNAGGIPKNILSKIFNPYFTTKEEGKGTGIGLYMTKTIIDRHFNGSIEVENIQDGAQFTIKFPKGDL